MPGIDGFETCRRMKAHHRAAHIPVVFMTGLTATQHVVRGCHEGGVDYVTKPLDTDVVLARLDAHLCSDRQVTTALEIGSASWRDRDSQDAKISVVEGAI